MNAEQRKALMEVIEAELDSYCSSPFNGAFAVRLMQVIDRLLAERHVETTVPDADAVERAAKALWDFTREGTDWEPWDTLQESYPSGMKGQAYYRDMARAALTAIHADIAARALSDEVVVKVAGAIGGGGPQSMDRYGHKNVSAAIRATVTLMAALGITESEAEV